MLYLKLDTNNQPERLGLEERHVRSELSHVSLPDLLTDEVLEPYGYSRLYMTEVTLPQVTKTHRVIVTGADWDGEKWVRVYDLEEITDEVIIKNRLDRKWAELKSHRSAAITHLQQEIDKTLRQQRMGETPDSDIAALDKTVKKWADITKLDDPFLVNLEEYVPE